MNPAQERFSSPSHIFGGIFNILHSVWHRNIVVGIGQHHGWLLTSFRKSYAGRFRMIGSAQSSDYERPASDWQHNSSWRCLAQHLKGENVRWFTAKKDLASPPRWRHSKQQHRSAARFSEVLKRVEIPWTCIFSCYEIRWRGGTSVSVTDGRKVEKYPEVDIKLEGLLRWGSSVVWMYSRLSLKLSENQIISRPVKL